MADVFEHLEAYAGEILHGWSDDEQSEKPPFQVVRLSGGPYAGTTAFSTLGLSNFPLPNGMTGDGARLIRHELLMVVPKDAVPGNIAAVLQQAGLEALSRNAAYLCGEMLVSPPH